MKLRIHNLILLCCLFAVLPSMSSHAYSQSLTALTESDIQTMLDGMDSAARKRNVAGMIAPLASDIKIKMSMLDPRSNKEVVSTLTKDQYAYNLRQNFRRKLAYRFDRKNTKIKIYNDQLAMVTSELYETIKMREGTIRAASSEVMYVSLRDGKLVITASEGRTRFY